MDHKFFSKREKGYVPRDRTEHKNTFSAVVDSTDHVDFVCDDCKKYAEILSVETVDTGTNYARLVFRLGCKICNKLGKRKMYFARD